jgi:hypothetical protein
LPTERVLTKCDQCIEFWKERNARGIPGEPPCDTCRVILLPENEIAASIYFLVRSQCELRWDGEKDIEVDLNQVALWKAIEKYPGGVSNEWVVFQKVNKCWHVIARERNK